MKSGSLIINALISFVFLALSCGQQATKSQDENPEYLANFYVRYIEDDGQFKAEVKFRQGASETSKSWESVENGVLLNGKALPARAIGSLGTVYTRTIKTQYLPIHTFNALGHQVKLNLPKAADARIDGLASKATGFRVNWQGPALVETETLAILLTDSSGKTFTLNRLGPSQKANTAILAEHLEQIANGEVSLRLVRKMTVELKNEKTFEGSGLSEYYSGSTTFTLTD